jgi:hypothetical protein
MFFEDPIQTVSVELPAGWAYNPFDSTLTDLYFTRWDQPGNLVGVHVRPASIPQEQPDEQWVEKIRSQVSHRASLTEMEVGGTCAVTADFSPGKGSAQRVVFMRGPRVELVIEQRNAGLESMHSWAPLEKAVQTIYSSVNRKEPEKRGANEFNQFVEAANEAFGKNDIPAVEEALQQAVQIGVSAWLHSLMPPVSSPELHAAVRVAQAMLHLSGLTGNLPMHRGAESVMRRALCTLESIGSTSETQPLMAELSETLNSIILEILEGTEGNGNASQILAMRERSFRLTYAASQAFEASELENAHSLSGMAVEDLLAVLAYLRRNQPQDVPEEIAVQLANQGITDPASQRETIQRARETLLFQPLNLSLQVRYCCALELMDGSPLEETEILIPLSELLYEANPGNSGIILARAIALMNGAAALALRAGDESLSEAEQCLRTAAHVLESVQEPHSGEDGWIRYHDRQIDGSLKAIDRRLTAIDSASQAKLLKLRSLFETIAEQFRGKVGK